MSTTGTFLQIFGIVSAISYGWTHDSIDPVWFVGTLAFVCGWACKRNEAVLEIKEKDGVVGVLKLLLLFQTPMNALIWFGIYGVPYGLGSIFN